MNKNSGNLYVVAAPSGTGKTTLVHAVAANLPFVTVSISHTTRTKRPAEKHGINYYFVSEDEFKQMIVRNEFFEYAKVFNNYYGTSKQWVEETLARGLDVVLEIDWQGAQQIHNLFPDSISVFILPPSRKALASRLINRNQDSSGIIEERLADVREATSHINEFNYVIINDEFDQAVQDLTTIIESGRLLRKRQVQRFDNLLNELCQIENYFDSGQQP